MTDGERMEHIENELQLLGITKRYRGYRQAVLAIELAMENEENLQNVTGRIYKTVAVHCGCAQSCIERNIRTISRVAWKANCPRLKQIARFPLYAPPAASEFISILATHLQRTQKEQLL
ncbi:MAG: hypothetical protein HFG00_03715 [Oscillibacter sp.]|nr:hypothetical protein [Oscillibacter sp.]